MRLFELTDTQVAMSDISQDPDVRRQQASMSTQQLAQAKAKEIEDERTSQDPLKKRIAQLRQQLAQLIQQDQQKTAQAAQQSQQVAGSVGSTTV